MAIMEQSAEAEWQAEQRLTHVFDQIAAAEEERAPEDEAWRELPDSV